MAVIWFLGSGMLAVALLAGGVRPRSWLTVAPTGTANGRSLRHAMAPTVDKSARLLGATGLAAYTTIIGSAAAVGPDRLRLLVIVPTTLVFVGTAAVVGALFGYRVWLVRPTRPSQVMGRFELTVAGSLLGLSALGLASAASPTLVGVLGALPILS